MSEAISTAEKEKTSAAWSSVVAAVLLTSMKLVVGLLTGSLGILSEAAHSGLDLVAALVTFFAVRVSDRPPDPEHPYGHGKIENMSALVETLLLLGTCVWIIYEAFQRLFFKTVEVEASIWAFGVMSISIVVDITRSRILYAAARKHNSQALEADALHFSTDIWSSSVVIVGLILVWLGDLLGPDWAWLAKADAIAALGVAVIVIWVSLQLGRRTVSTLIDTAPAGLADEISAKAVHVPGVQEAGPVRVRQAGPFTFVDLTVSVDRSASLEEAHRIASEVEQRVGELAPRGDVVVHVNPSQQQGETLPQTVGAIAARVGLRTHDVHAHEVRGQYFVDLHVEVPAGLTLEQAHGAVSELEAAIYGELPYVSEISSHIEPNQRPDVTDGGLTLEDERRLRALVEAELREFEGLHGCHHIQIRPGTSSYDVVLHCLADHDLPIAKAHHLADQVQKRLESRLPDVDRVLVHVEPKDAEPATD